MTERRVDVLVVRWYERRDRSPAIVPRWLAAAREHLPEAVPRRFGDSEPLRGRFDRAGEAGLLTSYGEARSLLFLSGTPPVHHASLAACESDRGPIQVHTLHVELPPAVPEDPRVQRFALALAHPGTVYVSASVENGVQLDRGTLYGPGATLPEPYLAAHGDWVGLPPSAPRWCWFGPDYARLVRRNLPDATPIVGGGAADGLLFTGGAAWVRPEWRARLDEADPARRFARRGPRGLRRSTLRLLIDSRRHR